MYMWSQTSQFSKLYLRRKTAIRIHKCVNQKFRSYLAFINAEEFPSENIYLNNTLRSYWNL